MTWFGWVTLGCIGVLVWLAARLSLKMSKGTERGSLPGNGDHIIEANYSSGAGGGGQQTTYRIPKDPQEYAKRFVPREKRK